MTEIIELREPFATLWQGKDPFAEVEKIGGETFREVKARRTLRFSAAGQSFFLKSHRGAGWGEIVKDLLCLRLPVLGADREWRAVHHLKAAGVGTMEGVAYGWRGRNPAAIASFIITRDISPSVNLHDYTAGWKDAPPSRALKSMLIGRVADMTGRMHRSGLNHRDCYLCHFLLSLPFDGREENLRLSLIDLHRAQIRSAVPRRWRDKDLAALFYSSRHLGLTRSDYARFLTAYFQMPLREVMRREASSLARIAGRSERIRARSQRKGA